MGGPPPRRSAAEVLEVLATADTITAAARSLGCHPASLWDRGTANPAIAEALREVGERKRERYREAEAEALEALELARRLKREQNEARAAEIVEALRGRTVSAAAKALGCSRAAIRYWGKRSAAVAEALAEVTARGPEVEPEAKARRAAEDAERGARMVAVIREHRTAAEAAKALGISPGNMTYWGKRIAAVREALDAQTERATGERERQAAERRAERERQAADRIAERERKAADRAQRRAALELDMGRNAEAKAERKRRRAALELEIERERLVEAQKDAEARARELARQAAEDAERQAAEDSARVLRAAEDEERQARMVQRERAEKVRRALLANEMAAAAERWAAQRRAVGERNAATCAEWERRKAAGRRLAVE